MATTGKLQCQLGTNTTSTINSAKVYNDGNWHQMFMVYQPASIPTITGTNALYAGNSGFAEVEKFSVAVANNGQEFLVLAVVRFAHKDDDFPTVERLGRRFGHIHFFSG